ncbi:MAG: CDP-diacylglycerol--serine O-phosphatidyltransferase [Salinivirgaceae bacterium]|jgi:CDP-diacylglycerol--serine O-phosphatidyltransferase
MSIKKYFAFVPNTITSFNVLSGCLSVVFAFEGFLVAAGIMILVAAVFDFFDGMSARLLGAYSEMGKQLDSLADVISFGLAPAAIAHAIVRQTILGNLPLSEAVFIDWVLILSPFIITVFSALRLAKFNIDTRQTESFIGLNTPSNAMVWATLPFVLKAYPNSSIAPIINQPYFIISLAVILSYLLVAEIPMFSLKFKNLKVKDNKIRFIFLAGNLILIAAIPMAALALIIIWYMVLSVLSNAISKKHKV